ncbi:MAG: type II secretion system F family protein [Candidatus Aenigmatarchaeota archaeon]|nr:type II secretion system F family protein [Candidatus Aenigmarchaeota archaeon]
MEEYSKIAIEIFGKIVEANLNLFTELRSDIKKSGMKKTLIEYVSTALLTCTIVFVVELPLLAVIFSLLKLGPMFSLFLSLTISTIFCILLFLFFLNYPKFIIRDKVKSIERSLPFATIYLSTISSSGIPVNKVFEIFAKFSREEEISEEAKRIVLDMKAFGLNIYDALLRSIERVPSIEFRDLLWSMTSIMKTGGDLSVFLRERSLNYLSNYRRKLTEFSRSLAIFLEIYLTVLILGAIFFTILTSIMMGIGGGLQNAVMIQFFIVFLFIPLVTFGFIVLIKSASPGGE